MKVNTLQRYDFTVDHYDFRVVQDAALNTTKEYFFSATIPCRIISDGSGRLLLHVREPLPMYSRVNNIRDKEGNLMVGAYQNDQGFSYDLTSVNPVMNAFGTRDALRYTLTRS